MKEKNLFNIDPDCLIHDGNGELKEGSETENLFCYTCDQRTEHWVRVITTGMDDTNSQGDKPFRQSVCQSCGSDHLIV